MLVLLVLVIVFWGVLPISEGATFVTLLVLGFVFLVMVIAGVVTYLALYVKAINLNRRQSNFIDSVTHELKSPIASLKLYLQTLKRRPLSPEEQGEFVQFMLDDVERLDLLINHILSAARLDKGNVAESAERVDLNQLLKSCVTEVCSWYRTSTEIVRMDLVNCHVLGNPVDLGLIFRNLLDNAIKYADSKSPEISVGSEYSPERGAVTIKISDNGPGIPRPLHRKIFGRFVRLGTELERKKPGTGLGLYIVRTLVARWRGRVQVGSKDGGGTVFQVTLPNATAIQAADNDSQTSTAIESSTPRPTEPSSNAMD